MGRRLVVAPNGVAFAPASVRPGVLPRMLDEILSTRIMVKVRSVKIMQDAFSVPGRDNRPWRQYLRYES
jgi:DNA polymerase elongation subunit (family B)